MTKNFVFSLFFFTFSLNAQDKPLTSFPRNEIKGNALLMLIGAAEFSCERLLSEETGIGLSAFFAYDKSINTKFSIAPHYRFYFGVKPASGFFIEGFGMLNSYNKPDEIEYLYNFNGIEGYNIKSGYSGTDFALGFGIGGKWVSKRGYFIELNSGLGRNIFYQNNNSDQKFVGRGGINVGYRF